MEDNNTKTNQNNTRRVTVMVNYPLQKPNIQKERYGGIQNCGSVGKVMHVFVVYIQALNKFLIAQYSKRLEREQYNIYCTVLLTSFV